MKTFRIYYKEIGVTRKHVPCFTAQADSAEAAIMALREARGTLLTVIAIFG